MSSNRQASLSHLNSLLNMGNVFQESRNSCFPIPWNMNINKPWNDDRITNAYVTKGFVVNVEIPARSQPNPSKAERETAARRLGRTMFASRWVTWIISRMIRLKKTILAVSMQRKFVLFSYVRGIYFNTPPHKLDSCFSPSFMPCSFCSY